MAERTVEDRLREECFVLLPEARSVVEELETQVRHCLLPVFAELDKYERLVVTSRIKECESAVEALRSRQEGSIFYPDKADSYTLTALNDLAGVRVLAFPGTRLTQSNDRLRDRYSTWASDPVRDEETKEIIAFKYHGYCAASKRVRAEFQIVPMLIGLFWQVEHSTIYKPSPELKGVAQSLEMRRRTVDVLRALKAFEDDFDRLVRAIR